MPRVNLLLVILTAGWSLPAIAIHGASDTFTLEVSTRARFLRPGEVVLISVKPSRPVTQVEGDGFGVALDFWPAGEAGEWQALVGIPLDAAAEPHDLVVRAVGADGDTATNTVPVTVQPAQFATRKIRVSRRFADPPDSVVARILDEAKTLEDLFAHSPAERFWRGPFRTPVPGRSTSSYGRLTVLNGKAGSRHQGADFRATLGTPVRAPNAGIVVLASELYFAGNTIVLDHGNGLVSLFAHLSQMAVEAGNRVARDDVIGEAGATGRVTGPHLHWAVRLHGTSVDPLSLSVAVAELQD